MSSNPRFIKCGRERRRQIVAELKHVCPPPLGWVVSVHAIEMEDGSYGHAVKYPKSHRFIIQVHKDLTVVETIDTLIHEWAHMMASGADWHPLSSQHDAVWGVWYARVYSAFHGEKS